MDQSTLAQQLPPMTMWGWVGDALGRRWAMIIPAAIAVALAPVYLLTTDFNWIAIGFVVQGAFGGPLYSQLPSYLSERCPTEVQDDGECLLLPPGSNLRRLCAVGADLLCRKLSGRARHSHAGGHLRGRDQCRYCAADQPLDQGQGADGGSRREREISDRPHRVPRG